MNKRNTVSLCLLVLLGFFNLTAFAWNNSVQIGYGYSIDPNNPQYDNSGFLLTSDLYPLKRTPWTYWSITGSLGQWHSTAPENKDLTTGAISLALRFYPPLAFRDVSPYLLASAGPAYLSDRQFGANTQGSNFTGQYNAGLGAELFNHFDINLRLSHYSNAYLVHPDDGFNVLTLLSVGYLF